MDTVIRIHTNSLPPFLIPTTWFEALGNARRVSPYRVQQHDDGSYSAICQVIGPEGHWTVPDSYHLSFGTSSNDAIKNLKASIREAYPK